MIRSADGAHHSLLIQPFKCTTCVGCLAFCRSKCSCMRGIDFAVAQSLTTHACSLYRDLAGEERADNDFCEVRWPASNVPICLT
eukprot:1158839-Pelagomonas_calceolata.AAC.10